MIRKKEFLSAILVVLILFGSITVQATDEKTINITANGKTATSLTDNNIYTFKSVTDIEISSTEGIYGVYIKYDRMPESFQIVADGETLPQSQTEYLHQFIELTGQNSIKILFDKATSVADVFAFTTKETPTWVQKWETLDKADIMVCPTHSDDDQLYFSGMIPWCVANGYDVQVVYFTNHWNTHDRPHELLDGLWTCGVKYYPVIPVVPDLYCTTLSQAHTVFNSVGYNIDYFVDYYIELFDRYKPLVVSCHDINGEYGHGAHMFNTTSIMSAIEKSAADGGWDVPKTYIHLWQDNKVVFNWDEPLEYFDGKSAFEVSQEGFMCHKSQHIFSSLYNWLYGTKYSAVTKASQIKTYSPCQFGLYRTTVGVDKQNNLFENLVSHKEQKANKELLQKAATLLGESSKLRLIKENTPSRIYFPLINVTTTDEDSSVTDASSTAASPNDNKNFKYTLPILTILVAITAFIPLMKRKRK